MGEKKYKVPKTAITERGLKKLIKEASKKHSSLSDWAVANNITPQAVTAFMRNVQSAGLQIPQALGYKPQTVFIPLDEDDICHKNPPRKPAQRPSAKVDHRREPVEKRHTAPRDVRKDTKKRMKERASGRR